MRIAAWIVRMLYRGGAVSELVKEMDKFKLHICVLQEIRWPRKGAVMKRNI
jgi:hypothetical protein